MLRLSILVLCSVAQVRAFVSPTLPSAAVARSHVRSLGTFMTAPEQRLGTFGAASFGPARPMECRRMSGLPQLKSAEAGATPPVKEIDYMRLLLWVSATCAQVGFFAAILTILDAIGARLPPLAAKVMAVMFFAVMSLKSRALSLLNAVRPTPSSVDETKRPGWAPPGIVFPIVWSTIGVLRTVSSVMIWEALGRTFFSLPLLAILVDPSALQGRVGKGDKRFAPHFHDLRAVAWCVLTGGSILQAHLSICDTWNAITNGENRRGSSIMTFPAVYASAVGVIYLYHSTLPLAGKVLAPSVVWFTIAGTLITQIWAMNGKDPLLPYRGD